MVMPTPFTCYGCKYPEIKADSRPFKFISILLLKIQCPGVHTQNKEGINVLILLYLTVLNSLCKIHRLE